MDEGQDGLLTRRRVLQTGAALVASAALPDVAFGAEGAPRIGAKTAGTGARHLRKGYRRRRFAPHVGTSVKLRPHGGAAQRVQLAGVEDVPNVAGLKGASDAYVLRFRGPAAQTLPEGIVGVRHKHFGTLQLYISRPPADGPNQDYLAAINRRIPRNKRRAR